jgi:sulfonate transport system permease protein
MSEPLRVDDLALVRSSTPVRRNPLRELPLGARIALGAALPVALIAIWQLVIVLDVIPAYRLPSPVSVILAGVDLYERGLLYLHIAISTQRVILGFAIGSLIGLIIASFVGLSRLGRYLVSPFLGGVRAIPSLAWVPLLGLYMGIGEDSKVTLIAIGAFFPVYTVVSNALRHTDPHLLEAGRAFGYTGLRLLALVQLPTAVPAVVSGLRLALAQSWLFLVAGELLGASMGLGWLLTDSNNNGRIDRLFLTILLLGLLGIVTDAIVGFLERVLLKHWGS